MMSFLHYREKSGRQQMKKRNRKTERNMAICSRREEGASYRQIAEEYGISIIRVRQILEAWKK